MTNRELYGKRDIDCIGNEVSLGSCYKELNRLIQCNVVNLTCRQAEAHQPFDEVSLESWVHSTDFRKVAS